MPESELFKMALQGGSFGLLVLGFIWAIGWGIPMIRDESRAARIAHTQTVADLLSEFREETRLQREFNRGEHERRDQAIQNLADAVSRLARRRRPPKPRAG